MTTLFNDAAAWREANQWKAVFATPCIDDTTTQLFANFGSMSDTDSPSPDRESIVTKIAEQFAMDVYMELKNDINDAQTRASRTSQGNRDLSKKPIQTQRTPVVTPHNNSRRVVRLGVGRGTTPLRDSRLPSF